MNLIKYIILGLVQGFTEPLPISSSGHVFLFKTLLGTNEILSDLNFEIIVNFGSLIAIVIIYFKDIVELIKHFFLYIKTKKDEYKSDFKYCLLIILGVIPVGLAGFLLKDRIESVLNTTTVLVGIAFLLTSVFLFFVRNIKGRKEDKDITVTDALFIGFVQVIALIPGISRSGTTLIAALSRDIKRTHALKYSFMLYIPISLGTMILGVKDLASTPNLSDYLLPYGLGFIASLIVSYFSLKWFRNIMNKGKLIYFSIYCLLLSLIVLFVL